MTNRTFFLLFLSLILTCCTDKPADIRLSRVEELASDSPKEALDSLGAINYGNLSDADKQYYDFLLIKAKDKAFIPHTSDSLILRVIDNEKKHQNRGRYPEALYYGGRVYHDMGDLPTALNYYHNAFDCISEDETQIVLRGCVLSQIGGLLNSLRLYNQAIPYMEEVVRLDSISKDSTNLMYALELLGSINIHVKRYESAERLFKRVKSLATALSPTDTVRHNMYLAAIKYSQGQIESALRLIRPTVLNIDSISRNVALAYACDIYRKANIPDTALLYANELIHSKNILNRKTGYKIILSDELIGLSPIDSIIRYINDYRSVVESYLNQNGNQAALIQNSLYNYQQHKRERIKAEADNERLNDLLVGISSLVLFLTVCILYLKYRNKSQLLKLQEAINNMRLLRQALNRSEEKQNGIPDGGQGAKLNSELTLDVFSTNIQDLRVHLREELRSICYAGNQSYSVSPTILESEAYEKVIGYIDKGRIIPEKLSLWKELEEVVLKSSPEFKYKLHLLTGGKLKPIDFHLALLIKCGISSTDMSTLIGRAKSTITYRKYTLGLKVFDEKLDAGVIDGIIRLL